MTGTEPDEASGVDAVNVHGIEEDPVVVRTPKTWRIAFAATGVAGFLLVGMSLGRDVKALRSLSWRIVIVALMTFTASFLAAAVIAQIAFHF